MLRSLTRVRIFNGAKTKQYYTTQTARAPSEGIKQSHTKQSAYDWNQELMKASENKNRLKQIWQEMKTNKIKPDSFTFGSLLFPFTKKGDVYHSQWVWNEMAEAHCPPGSFHYTSFLSLFAKRGM